jgi:hypothetical protein
MNGFKAGPRNQNSFLINNFQDNQNRAKRACYQTATRLLGMRSPTGASFSFQVLAATGPVAALPIRSEILVFLMFSQI